MPERIPEKAKGTLAMALAALNDISMTHQLTSNQENIRDICKETLEKEAKEIQALREITVWKDQAKKQRWLEIAGEHAGIVMPRGNSGTDFTVLTQRGDRVATGQDLKGVTLRQAEQYLEAQHALSPYPQLTPQHLGYQQDQPEKDTEKTHEPHQLQSLIDYARAALDHAAQTAVEQNDTPAAILINRSLATLFDLEDRRAIEQPAKERPDKHKQQDSHHDPAQEFYDHHIAPLTQHGPERLNDLSDDIGAEYAGLMAEWNHIKSEQQDTLKAHIDEYNARAPEGTPPLANDPDHWAEYNVTTPDHLDDYLDTEAYRQRANDNAPERGLIYPAEWGWDKYEPAAQEAASRFSAIIDNKTLSTDERITACGELDGWRMEQIKQGDLPSHLQTGYQMDHANRGINDQPPHWYIPEHPREPFELIADHQVKARVWPNASSHEFSVFNEQGEETKFPDKKAAFEHVQAQVLPDHQDEIPQDLARTGVSPITGHTIDPAHSRKARDSYQEHQIEQMEQMLKGKDAGQVLFGHPQHSPDARGLTQKEDPSNREFIEIYIEKRYELHKGIARQAFREAATNKKKAAEIPAPQQELPGGDRRELFLSLDQKQKSQATKEAVKLKAQIDRDPDNTAHIDKFLQGQSNNLAKQVNLTPSKAKHAIEFAFWDRNNAIRHSTYTKHLQQQQTRSKDKPQMLHRPTRSPDKTDTKHADREKGRDSEDNRDR